MESNPGCFLSSFLLPVCPSAHNTHPHPTYQLRATTNTETMSATPTPPPPTETHNPLQVLIVGGGVAGLMMALLLERINIPYTIFERAIKVRPLGSVLSLNANILPVFEQLDLLED